MGSSSYRGGWDSRGGCWGWGRGSSGTTFESSDSHQDYKFDSLEERPQRGRGWGWGWGGWGSWGGYWGIHEMGTPMTKQFESTDVIMKMAIDSSSDEDMPEWFDSSEMKDKVEYPSLGIDS